RGADARHPRAHERGARRGARARRPRGEAGEPRRGLSHADPAGAVMRLFWHELKGELRLYGRSRELAFFTFMLPIIFFVLLGSVYGSRDRINGYRGADYLLTGMIGYGVAATGFAGLAIVLVIRRENGVLKRLRATPLPVSFISGAFFSQQHFPGFLQKIADVLPLTYFIDLVGSVMLKGVALWDRPTDVLVLVAWGVGGTIFALRYFRWVPQEG